MEAPKVRQCDQCKDWFEATFLWLPEGVSPSLLSLGWSELRCRACHDPSSEKTDVGRHKEGERFIYLGRDGKVDKTLTPVELWVKDKDSFYVSQTRHALSTLPEERLTNLHALTVHELRRRRVLQQTRKEEQERQRRERDWRYHHEFIDEMKRQPEGDYDTLCGACGWYGQDHHVNGLPEDRSVRICGSCMSYIGYKAWSTITADTIPPVPSRDIKPPKC